MPPKIMIILLLLPGLAGAEIIQQSRLKIARKPHSSQRNLFLPGMMAATAPSQQPPSQAAMAEETHNTLQETLAQSIQYGGTFSIGETMVALLNVSGESFSVKEGEVILEQIKIIKITPDQVTVEYEGQSFTISKNKET